MKGEYMLGETGGVIDVTASGYLISRTINLIPNAITQYPETRVFHIHLVSSSTASVITISNGQGGTIFIKETGSFSTGADFDYGLIGVTFPLGAYVTVDGNIVSAAITCKADKF